MAVRMSLTGRKVFFAALGAALALAVAGTVFAMGGKDKNASGSQASAPVSVVAAKAVGGDFPVFFQGLGTVTALNTVTVKSRVDGELIALHFTEGQEVKAGDLLAEIDPRPYQAELTQAEGQLLRDRALLQNARQDLKRYKILLPQDSATPQQVDAAEAAVRQYEAAVKVDQGQIAAVKLQLEYCRVTAPVSGRLGLKLVDQGNIVRAADSTGIVVITQMAPISVLFTVTEGQLPQVQAGMKQNDLLVEAWDRTRTNLLASGKLLTTDNRIDTATGTVKLKALFDNTSGALFPNQFVNARVRVKTVENAVLVPTAAVQHSSRGAFVFVVESGKAVLRGVTPAEGDDEVTVITQGVQADDVLIIDGLDRLRDGTPVTAVFPERGA
ncbi:MAG: Multidrug resistance protein MdtA [Desulfovibrio sp.]